jgi:hypothetical protein
MQTELIKEKHMPAKFVRIPYSLRDHYMVGKSYCVKHANELGLLVDALPNKGICTLCKGGECLGTIHTSYTYIGHGFIESISIPTPLPIKRSIELIASGYDWRCPECDEFNHTIEVVESVTCPTCKKTYSVRDYYHAHK